MIAGSGGGEAVGEKLAVALRVVDDVTRPTIATLGPMAPLLRGGALDVVPVVFSEPLAAGSFGPADVDLTRDGTALATAGLVAVQTGSRGYEIRGLAALTGVSGAYEQSVRTAGVVDTNGNAGLVRVVVGFEVDATAPAVTAVVGPAGPSRFPTASVDVTFSEPIDESSFTRADVTLARGGAVLLAGGLTITPLGGASYRIGGLTNLTSPDGAYTLTVDATGVRDPAGNAGAGSMRASFVVAPGVIQGDYDGDGRSDLALDNTPLGDWRIGDEASGSNETRPRFGPVGTSVVPVLAPLFFRLRATGNIGATAFAGRAVDEGAGLVAARRLAAGSIGLGVAAAASKGTGRGDQWHPSGTVTGAGGPRRARPLWGRRIGRA